MTSPAALAPTAGPAQASAATAPDESHFDVIVIGGGASGALMALHLDRAAPELRVAVVERSGLLGCGIAYGSGDPDHLLNTRVHNMSAFADQPDHFLDWLRGTGSQPGAMPDSFVGRPLYGSYLGELMRRASAGQDTGFDSGIQTPPQSMPPLAGLHNPAATAIAGRPDAAPPAGRVHCLRGECTRLSETPEGVTATLADGTRLTAGRAVLATGHATPAADRSGLASGWDFSGPGDRDADVVVIGTGLSMIDHVLSLLRNGHRGRITCLSRRGLLPREHRPASAMPIAEADVPLGRPVSVVLRWLRGMAREAGRRGGTWRDAVDGLRPHVARIWQTWDTASRRRFLRHGAAWWEVHRHRMPPSSGTQLSRAMEQGQLRILKARFVAVEPDAGGKQVRLIEAGVHKSLTAGHVIDCRGIRRDPARDAVAVVRDLLARGEARLDTLELGLDTTLEARLVDASGRASKRIFAIGPCARGALWEITAIPDIRVQCAALARLLAAG